eukprot:TRINITY_DN27905_c0_g1_i4.p1 TRINITY_DN27905_c0_g1~~TRINITY_DN27905_c0_g1_i4.p1  ORF type:complete len:110 (+),score=17.96 TRINITY_DN27905_c0_g1_i4:921-1250(+)
MDCKIGGGFEIRKVGRRFSSEWGEDREEIHQVESMKLGKIFLEVPAFWWIIRSKQIKSALVSWALQAKEFKGLWPQMFIDNGETQLMAHNKEAAAVEIRPGPPHGRLLQ